MTDLKGSSLGSLRVVADSATRDSDEVVIVSKEELSPLAGQE